MAQATRSEYLSVFCALAVTNDEAEDSKGMVTSIIESRLSRITRFGLPKLVINVHADLFSRLCSDVVGNSDVRRNTVKGNGVQVEKVFG